VNCENRSGQDGETSDADGSARTVNPQEHHAPGQEEGVGADEDQVNGAGNVEIWSGGGAMASLAGEKGRMLHGERGKVTKVKATKCGEDAGRL